MTHKHFNQRAKAKNNIDVCVCVRKGKEISTAF